MRSKKSFRRPGAGNRNRPMERREAPLPSRGSAPRGGATTQNLPLPPARGFAPPGRCLAPPAPPGAPSSFPEKGQGEGNRERARPAPTKQQGGGALAFSASHNRTSRHGRARQRY